MPTGATATGSTRSARDTADPPSTSSWTGTRSGTTGWTGSGSTPGWTTARSPATGSATTAGGPPRPRRAAGPASPTASSHSPTRPLTGVPTAQFIFLSPERWAAFYRNWEGIALDAVGSLRAEAGRDPGDRALSDLIGELATRSEQFRVRWAGHDVRSYLSGVQPFTHPVVGDLNLAFDALEVPADPGQTIVAYTAQTGSPSEEKLALLASWAVTDVPPPHEVKAAEA